MRDIGRHAAHRHDGRIPWPAQDPRAGRQVDFLSVGSNDLTQYLLAVDRNNPRVADLYDYLHPAVLHALKKVVDDAHLEGKPVSICGEMAGDPAAAVLLMAMGFDSLSMNATNLPKVKWLLRQITLDKARDLLGQLLTFDNPQVIHSSTPGVAQPRPGSRDQPGGGYRQP
ncbi:hypothetical protein QJ974_01810 [Pseudomonas aeruginosa]|uniref:putative PEP-binding protein n=1 Tax=Pseudomonas aeruginosa TaxID=287 RepID=UPI002499BDF7|nr:putative PEP-binding protein [Pseudomonas aeruginosa]WGW99250.1 hypothetical protein QJ974_01810 [Pseudomonas aeruginosa]